MAAHTAKADFRDLNDLLVSLRRVSPVLLFKATDRATALVRAEAPGGPSGRVGRGVSKDFDRAARPPEGFVVVYAPANRRAGIATLHLPGGGTRQVSTRGSAEVNVGELLAEGTGVYGPRHARIAPRHGKALLISVDSVDGRESYLEQGGTRFVFRLHSSGVRPDDYPGRAADALDSEVDGLADKALREGGVL